MQDILFDKQNHLVFYGLVSPDDKIRDASREAEKKFKDFFTEFYAEEDLFQLVCILSNYPNKDTSIKCHNCYLMIRTANLLRKVWVFQQVLNERLSLEV